MARAPLHIVLSVSEGLYYSRHTALGIRRALAAADRPCQVALIDSTALSRREVVFKRCQAADAVIGFLVAEVARRLTEAGKPVVAVSQACRAICPTVLPDEAAMGELAAEHLLGLGHRRVAFVNFNSGPSWSIRRQALATAIEASAGQCLPVTWNGEVDDALRAALDGATAAAGSTDFCARRIIEVGGELGRVVPDDLAVLGFDNDTFTCELAEVPLTSIDPNPDQIGVRAGQLLLELLDGRQAPQGPVTVEPIGVVARASTDLLAFEDPQIRQALEYIQLHACDPMTVGEMMEAVQVSRRTLEKRFAEILGCTILQQIRRVRFERARRLLIETALPVSRIAGRCGFDNHARFSAQFKEYFGLPPTGYRNRHAPGAPAVP